MNISWGARLQWKSLLRLLSTNFKLSARQLLARNNGGFRHARILTNTSNSLIIDSNLYNPRLQYADISPKPAISEETKKERTEPPTPNPDPNGNERTLPRLMNFPEIMWPSMFNSMRNWVLVYGIIRPYFDREFYVKEFIRGAKRAMQVVSIKLMNADFAGLQDLVTPEALAELKPVIQKLSVSQRRQLEVQESDVYLMFPYQVGIMFDEGNEHEIQKRWVEITMVFHILRGLREIQESGEEMPWNFGIMPEYQDKVFVCNYRFIKEFTSGRESDWTINIVNHFKPLDLIKEMKRV
uniref:Tim44-like domain-containing protein n=1 Tax=Glossina brevipalpis TaxID=37001 RepID=A0A1A9WI77_9MUSC